MLDHEWVIRNYPTHKLRSADVLIFLEQNCCASENIVQQLAHRYLVTLTSQEALNKLRRFVWLTFLHTLSHRFYRVLGDSLAIFGHFSDAAQLFVFLSQVFILSFLEYQHFSNRLFNSSYFE